MTRETFFKALWAILLVGLLMAAGWMTARAPSEPHAAQHAAKPPTAPMHKGEIAAAHSGLKSAEERVVDKAAIAAARKAADDEVAAAGERRDRLGFHIPIDDAPDFWTRQDSSDGRVVWHTSVRAPGAVFLRARVAIDEGASGELSIAGPVDDNGRRISRRVTSDTTLWSPLVEGDEALLTWIGTANADRPPVRVLDLAYGERDPLPEAKVGSCHLDINCYSEWAAVKSAIAMMVFEDGVNTYTCTGSLLSDADGSDKNWFITANHCISSQSVAETLLTLWDYETDACNGDPPPGPGAVPQANGATFITGSRFEDGDGTLLRLVEAPPPGTAKLKFSLDDLSPGDTVYGIHHPGGSYKRFFIGQAVDGSIAGVEDGNYWIVTYDEGNTEQGSSGSPLFNDDKRVVGTLTGGESTCETRAGADIFGRFDKAWQEGYRDYLAEGENSGGDDDGDSGLSSLGSGEELTPSESKDEEDDAGCGC